MGGDLLIAIRILDLFLIQAPAAYDAALDLAATFKALYADGHVPTAEEFATLDGRLATAHSRLQAAGVAP